MCNMLSPVFFFFGGLQTYSDIKLGTEHVKEFFNLKN